MGTLYKEKDGTISVHVGAGINEAIREGIEMAQDLGSVVQFTFNDVEVNVSATSNPELIYRDWDRAMRGCVESKSVGPAPSKRLSPEEVENDERVESENRRAAFRRREEYAAEQARRTELLNDRLASAPPLEMRDPEAWAKCKSINSDPYGAAAVRFAENWARLMQAEIASGKKLADVADGLSRKCDDEGITGFMYGCAVSILSQCWIHGEDLRRWHNSATQVNGEGDAANESGGVLNPALLVINT